jgi:hypothetical protein
MRAVRFTVHGALLREMMHMPDTARFVDASIVDRWQPGDVLEFVVVDDAIPQADGPHETDPVLTNVYDEDGTVKDVLWDWNVKT